MLWLDKAWYPGQDSETVQSAVQQLFLDVFRQMGLIAHGLKLKPVFIMAVCWPWIHLLQAWTGCWKGQLNHAD